MSNRFQKALDEMRSILKRVSLYEEAIRKHRDQRGDDRCWRDDEELYKILPEGYTPPERDTSVEAANCLKFMASRQCPAIQYTSPQRRIEELEQRVAELEEENRQLTKSVEHLETREASLCKGGMAMAEENVLLKEACLRMRELGLDRFDLGLRGLADALNILPSLWLSWCNEAKKRRKAGHESVRIGESPEDAEKYAEQRKDAASQEGVVRITIRDAEGMQAGTGKTFAAGIIREALALYFDVIESGFNHSLHCDYLRIRRKSAEDLRSIPR